MTEHAPGVWLNQRHADYLEDDALGYTAIVDLAASPVEWWHDSKNNPFRPVPPVNLAFARGEALHVRTLYGPKAYDRLYGVNPTLRSHPGYIDLVRDLQEACFKNNLPAVGAKPELIDRLIRAKAPVQLLAAAQREFAKSGKLPIDEADDARIKILWQLIFRSRQELKTNDGEMITAAEALKNALTEVSVFWVDENGIRQRARFDWLKPNISGDLKSITEWRRSDFKVSLLREIIIRGYHVQWAHYDEARRQLCIACDEGRVFGGNKTQRKRLMAIADSAAWSWMWIFAKMDGAPRVRGIIPHPEAGQYAKAVAIRREALAMYLHHFELFDGLKNPWLDLDVMWEPEETDWPSFVDLLDT